MPVCERSVYCLQCCVWLISAMLTHVNPGHCFQGARVNGCTTGDPDEGKLQGGLHLWVSLLIMEGHSLCGMCYNRRTPCSDCLCVAAACPWAVVLRNILVDSDLCHPMTVTATDCGCNMPLTMPSEPCSNTIIRKDHVCSQARKSTRISAVWQAEHSVKGPGRTAGDSSSEC
jgi:hypothetical protein